MTPLETLLTVPDVAWVRLQLADGWPLTVYPLHAPLVAETVAAPVRYATDGGVQEVAVAEGILQVGAEEVVVMTLGILVEEMATEGNQ